MKCNDPIARAVRVASKGICRFKVVAIGLNDRGVIIGMARNSPRFIRRGGGDHAELKLMRKSPKSLRRILILRVSNVGKLLPIQACKVCQRKADELGIKIIEVRP